jgi:phage gp46-like protein
MSDVKLIWNRAAQSADIAIVNGDLVTDDTLETAVIISLFSNRRADDDDVLPDFVNAQMPGSGDRRGWWGDHYAPELLAAIVAGIGVTPQPTDRWGSRLWLLRREKDLASVLARAKEYAQEALQWLLDNDVASAVNVTASSLQGDPGAARTLLLQIEIVKPDRTTENYAFDYAWRALAGLGGLAGNAAPNPSVLDQFILDESSLA